MPDQREKRSSTDGMTAESQHLGSTRQGVGGRQRDPATGQQGGGSPDICTESECPVGASKKSRDERIDELREIGLRPQWLEIAREIGVDNFLCVWKILNDYYPDGHTTISVPRFSRYLKYQRNRYILTLDAQGFCSDEIRRRVRSELCEEISVRHIDRLTAKRRKQARIDS